MTEFSVLCDDEGRLKGNNIKAGENPTKTASSAYSSPSTFLSFSLSLHARRTTRYEGKCDSCFTQWIMVVEKTVEGTVSTYAYSLCSNEPQLSRDARYLKLYHCIFVVFLFILFPRTWIEAAFVGRSEFLFHRSLASPTLLLSHSLSFLGRRTAHTMEVQLVRAANAGLHVVTQSW